MQSITDFRVTKEVLPEAQVQNPPVPQDVYLSAHLQCYVPTQMEKSRSSKNLSARKSMVVLKTADNGNSRRSRMIPFEVSDIDTMEKNGTEGNELLAEDSKVVPEASDSNSEYSEVKSRNSRAMNGSSSHFRTGSNAKKKKKVPSYMKPTQSVSRKSYM